MKNRLKEKIATVWRLGGILATVTVLSSCTSPEVETHDDGPPQFRWQNLDTLLWSQILAAEDARATSDSELEPILLGVESSSPETRQIAVRALGRMERPEMVSRIAPLLSDSIPFVRAEAANALAQSVFDGEAGVAMAPLVDRLGVEHDPYVRGVIAQALGRLPYTSADTVRLVDATLATALEDSNPSALIQTLRGVYALVRREGADSPPSDRALDRLVELSGLEDGYGVSKRLAVQIRRYATLALVATGRVDSIILQNALGDADPEVRRIGATAIWRLAALDGRSRLLSQALADEDGTVRMFAHRANMRFLAPQEACPLAITAVSDEDPDVVLTAVDLLGQNCAYESGVEEMLEGLVSRLPSSESPSFESQYLESWHVPAHALVALANIGSDRLDDLFPRFVEHENWWVRLYAARAAFASNDSALLYRLAFDSTDNVREAATRGLSRLVGHEADSVYRAQLRRQDYQLIITSGSALEGTPDRGRALAALFDALERVSAERRETSRDPRKALLRRIGELGGRSQAVALGMYLNDFDPAIAALTDTILTNWTGRRHEASPRPLPKLPLPSFNEMTNLADSVAVLSMRGGGEIEITLYPFEAPTNVARFARLARSGYFDGLTFHRVVRGFVIQGGSPGANEFAGDGPFTRDEISSRTQARGTIGVSVRGRDTVDGQIYINIVDNPRLDFNYTLIGEVTRGMEVVDAILEGAVIEEILWRPSRRQQ